MSLITHFFNTPIYDKAEYTKNPSGTVLSPELCDALNLNCDAYKTLRVIGKLLIKIELLLKL